MPQVIALVPGLRRGTCLDDRLTTLFLGSCEPAEDCWTEIADAFVGESTGVYGAPGHLRFDACAYHVDRRGKKIQGSVRCRCQWHRIIRRDTLSNRFWEEFEDVIGQYEENIRRLQAKTRPLPPRLLIFFDVHALSGIPAWQAHPDVEAMLEVLAEMLETVSEGQPVVVIGNGDAEDEEPEWSIQEVIDECAGSLS